VFVFSKICYTVDKIKVESAKSNGFSQMKVLMLEERLNQKRLHIFKSSLQPQALLV
jgi:hypothetical protein